MNCVTCNAPVTRATVRLGDIVPGLVSSRVGVCAQCQATLAARPVPEGIEKTSRRIFMALRQYQPKGLVWVGDRDRAVHAAYIRAVFGPGPVNDYQVRGRVGEYFAADSGTLTALVSLDAEPWSCPVVAVTTGTLSDWTLGRVLHVSEVVFTAQPHAGGLDWRKKV